MTPQCLIIRTAGTNCECELVHAFELAGAQTRVVHLNDLIAHPQAFEEADLIGIPGGFSYGDDIAAGRIFANRLRHRLAGPIRAAINRGTPIIGICNGFQVLVKLGLLPEPGECGVTALSGLHPSGAPGGGGGIEEPPHPSPLPLKAGGEGVEPNHPGPLPPPSGGGSGGEGAMQCATLADNLSGRFVDRWVRLVVPERTVCLWTRGLGEIELPVAHGEGRFVPASPEQLERWRQRGQIALRYAADDNPNGSVDDIAGVCDPSGLVLGLMPHPERFTHPTHHPAWTRLDPAALAQTPAGLRFFQNAVEHVRERRAAG